MSLNIDYDSLSYSFSVVFVHIDDYENSTVIVIEC